MGNLRLPRYCPCLAIDLSEWAFHRLNWRQMPFRTAQFACLMLLLAAFGAADSAARSVSGPCRDCASLRLFLSQVAAVTAAEPIPEPVPAASEVRALPVAARNQVSQPWGMRPPVAHSLALHAVTGSSL